MSLSRLLPALCAVLAVIIGVALTGCGDSVPDDGVAKVSDARGDGVITKDDFDRWMTVAARRGSQGQGSSPVPMPDPPDFATCVAYKKKGAPKPAKGQPTPTDAQFKAQCEQQWEQVRDQVLGFLIAAEWVKGEAEERDITVSDEDIDTTFAQQRKQAFPKEADFKKFLDESGSTEDDVRFQIEVELLQKKLADDVAKGADEVTSEQIAEYFKENKQQFGAPASRDVRVILTKTREQAERAKAALERGESWAAVAKRASLDVASKDRGGELEGVTKGQQLQPIDDAVFAAKKNVTGGPIKTPYGYYVYRVTKITKAGGQSLNEATPTIKPVLTAQNRRKALDEFLKDYREKWRERTNCREGYVVRDCRNAKGSETSTAGPGTTQPPSSAP